MRKQLTFQGATTYFPFPTKRLLGKKHKNSILKRFPYQDLSSASDWSYCEGNLLQLIRSTTQIFTVFNEVLSRPQKLWSRWRRKKLPLKARIARGAWGYISSILEQKRKSLNRAQTFLVDSTV